MADLQTPNAPDPATERTDLRNSRRKFFKTAGATAGAAALFIAGCDSTGPGDPDPGPIPGPGQTSDPITLDFSTDFGVLNFAYVLEQLESRFYSIACKGENSPYEGINDLERYYLSALDAHEGVHDTFFRNAIPAEQRIADDLAFNFESVDFTSRSSVLGTARTLEDVGVSAYNGAASFFSGPQAAFFLLYAGKIVSVEARHAAAIRQIILSGPEAFADLDSNEGATAPLSSLGTVPDNALDAALPPDEVIALAQGFIESEITITGIS